MPLIRPSQARALRCIRKPIQRSNLSMTARRAGGDSHGSHYDPPSGWLWGIPPGQKYEKEGWENIFYYMFCGGCVAAAVGYAFKPDTSIQTWALEEARRRLEAEGILEDPESK
ncbi:hypothetical protein, variant [Verruconis gallopava]|uniref:NADH dehydrogenase [ubiquinone] 1 beta subcomplex subunit 11, mitochondrial n=1 Tax=Verruconis gallopava TaxID=253628 RepID=A0A0D1XLF2_9PEZI|nr:uncharacterized protein PV09_05477 [Verruconis gallopava]XP_016213126.1 hypothetical protein, variant [Verruconis gallopava]KIW03256.1 hypothetical protein PV09_05477 [Verruconis gallopava]KIW03257.1 hypothetical protein, variant [Verruconis gallopava]